jgi:hypothetical protein
MYQCTIWTNEREGKGIWEKGRKTILGTKGIKKRKGLKDKDTK